MIKTDVQSPRQPLRPEGLSWVNEGLSHLVIRTEAADIAHSTSAPAPWVAPEVSTKNVHLLKNLICNIRLLGEYGEGTSRRSVLS